MQSRCLLYVHLVWATWDRAPVISADDAAWLWPVIAGKARMLGCCRVTVGGVADHVHVVADLPATISVAEFARQLKGASSAVANDKLGRGAFKWQGGYAAFTMREVDVPTVEAYVRGQPEHHAAGKLISEIEAMPTLPTSPQGAGGNI